MPEPASQPLTGGGADRDLPPRMPRWVKVAAIVVGVLIARFLILQLTGVAGEHGPARHLSGSGTLLEGATGGQAPVAADLR